jgi:hypothetical protein
MQVGMTIELGMVKADVDSLLATVACLDSSVIPEFWRRRLSSEAGERPELRSKLRKLNQAFASLNEERGNNDWS